MKLPDMNVEYENNREHPAAPVAHPGRAPGDRKPKRSVAQAQQAAAVADLVRSARANGDSLTGPTGLLKQVTAMVLEAALEEEMTEHLGRAKHRGNPALEDESVDDADHHVDGDGDGDGDGHGRTRNVRNGSRTKTVLTDNAGKVDITVPRDRAGTFEPVIVPKRPKDVWTQIWSNNPAERLKSRDPPSYRLRGNLPPVARRSSAWSARSRPNKPTNGPKDAATLD